MKIIETSIRVEDYEKVCCNCTFFEQHYMLRKGVNKIFLCNAGYCTKSRIKSKKAVHKACEHFEQRKGEHND